MKAPKILLTGSNGQLGTVLARSLADIYGEEQIVVSDIWQNHPHGSLTYEVLNVLDSDAIKSIIEKYSITQVYHLAAILSAAGEQNPARTWQVNMDGYLNILEACREHKIERVFYPSSIAVFGSLTKKNPTPQLAVLDPETVYGISKAAGEYWSAYYFNKFGLDVRSIRYPGIISYQSKPGGGTTDYAVDIFHQAIENGSYSCFLKANTTLPMIYIDDAIRATIELMDASSEKIKTRTSYNLAGLSFSPLQLATAIRKVIPSFEISYDPDYRQGIADSWPDKIDDTAAQSDWGWRAEYGLEDMTQLMLRNLMPV